MSVNKKCQNMIICLFLKLFWGFCRSKGVIYSFPLKWPQNCFLYVGHNDWI